MNVGNIAQNGYFNAVVQRELGYESYVINHDNYHFASSPEWLSLNQAGIESVDLGDDFFPNFFQFDQAASSHFPWFVQGPQVMSLNCLWLRLMSFHKLANRASELVTFLRFKCVCEKDSMGYQKIWNQKDFENWLVITL